jgi:hypothetical protein
VDDVQYSGSGGVSRMACDDLSKACQKVGRFLYDFALVEQEINERIAAILNLKGDAADVVSNSVDFFRKANILRTIAFETAPPEEKDAIGKLFSMIAKENDNRVLMAHSSFEPANEEGVQFSRTVARDGKVTVHDPLWTKQQFEQASARLTDIQGKLAKLRPKLTFKVTEGRSDVFAHYLYTPASTWVPSGAG